MKKNLFRNFALITMLVFLVSGCEKKKDDPDPAPVVVSPGKQIVHFKIVDPAATAVLDTTARTIVVAVPAGTDVTALKTDISLATGCTITPASGAVQNFTNPVTYTVTGSNQKTTAWTVRVDITGASAVVDEDITKSVTWTANKVYVINSEIEVTDGGILTIEPGTVIKFGPNGKLSIGYGTNATVIAKGTAAKPIIFTSSALLPTAGAWRGIYFYNNTLSNTVLEYCQILFAGKNTGEGAVTVAGCDITMKNCIISNSSLNGIHTYYSEPNGGFVAFENNTISNTGGYAIEMNAQKIGAIGSGNTFENTKGIHITGGYESSTAQTWKNLGVPYIITDEVDIDGTLTIEPGTTFRFEANGWMEIGYSESTTFTANGSVSAPITFTSNAVSPTAGAWKGIVIYDRTQSNSIMNFCTIEYAGKSATNTAALDMRGATSIQFTNSKIQYSQGYGILLAANAGFQTFTNNEISNCANHVISMSHLHLPDLGSPNTLTAAPGKGIKLQDNASYSAPVTWKKQTAEFYVTGSADIEIDGDVTIEAGCTFRFDPYAYYYFGYTQNTRITAMGTSANRITFTSSAASPAAGAWRGLYFDDNVQTNSTLSYCQIQYTGRDLKPAMFTNTSISVNNTLINNHDSGSNPAKYHTGTAVPTGTGNNFTWAAGTY